MSTVTTQELELETAELLPARETLFVGVGAGGPMGPPRYYPGPVHHLGPGGPPYPGPVHPDPGGPGYPGPPVNGTPITPL
jgi:hypothetical protein